MPFSTAQKNIREKKHGNSYKNNMGIQGVHKTTYLENHLLI